MTDAPITKLRAELARRGLDGFLAPRADRHQGEYVPACDARLAWLTGFDGSAGVALILADRALLFVDGRYEIQARAQTPADGPDAVEIAPTADTPLADWLARNLAAGTRLAYDPWLHARAEIRRLTEAAEKAGAALVAVEDNPVDAVWADRPAPPATPAAPYPAALAGASAMEKRAALAKLMVEERLDAAVLTQPDAVAWLTNTRGADLPHVPVTLAYALLRADGALTLYSRPEQWAEVADALGQGVEVAPWQAFPAALDALSGARVAVDESLAPAAIGARLEAAGAEIVWRRDLALGPKARKTPAELKGAVEAQKRDGAALVEALAWIERAAPSGALDELAVSDALTRIRSETGQRLGAPLLDVSFPPIVGFGPNGAIVHYRVTPESSRPILGDGLLLIDSGGQYQDGTTDVTRTVAIGAPGPAEIDAFTRVLEGMIAVTRLWFPEKTAGREIDAFARAALWRAGLDYGHGTGHGVGAYLSVHEGPASISRRGDARLEPGMILSNEPGVYAAGRFGIRIENLVTVRAPAPPPEAPDALEAVRPMLSFETLTLAPIARRLIDVARLSPTARAWLDDYHARVDREIGPLIADRSTRAWLTEACAPL